jgi:hypothetical protein
MQLNLSPVNRNRRSPIFHQMRNRIPVVVALCPEHAQEIGSGRVCTPVDIPMRLGVYSLSG